MATLLKDENHVDWTVSMIKLNKLVRNPCQIELPSFIQPYRYIAQNSYLNIQQLYNTMRHHTTLMKETKK